MNCSKARVSWSCTLKTAKSICKKGPSIFDAEYVVFDGSIIKAFLEEEEVVHRVVAVHYGWRPEKWLYDRLPKRIFHVSETLELESNPKVFQIVDTIKGIVKKKK